MPRPTEALAWSEGSRAHAEQVVTILRGQGYAAEVADAGWGTGELVVTIRLNCRLAAFLGLKGIV